MQIHRTRGLFGVAAGALFAATVALGAGSSEAQELRKLQMAVPSVTLPTIPPMIADRMGLFEKHGIDVEFVVVETASAATTALISKSLEVVVGGPGEHVAAAGRGQEIVAISNLYKGLGGTIVLSKEAAEKSGVKADAPAAERWKALNDLVIASPSPTSSYTVAVRTAAAAEGSKPQFAFMPFTNMIAATDTGAVAGFMSSAPVWTTPVVNGGSVLWLSGPLGDFPADNIPASSTSIQMMRATAEADPELVKTLRTIMDEFRVALREDPEKSKQAMAAIFPSLDEKAIDLIYTNEFPAMATVPLTVDDMRHEIDFVKNAGANIPDIDKIDPARMILD